MWLENCTQSVTQVQGVLTVSPICLENTEAEALVSVLSRKGIVVFCWDKSLDNPLKVHL